MPRTRTSGQGRPKGARNKVSREREKQIAASGLTPLDFMLDLLRTEPAPLPLPPAPITAEDVRRFVSSTEMRFEAAKAAAPYVHPRLANIEHAAPGGGPLVIEIVKFGAKDA